MAAEPGASRPPTCVTRTEELMDLSFRLAALAPGLLLTIVIAAFARASTAVLPSYVSEVSVGVLAGLVLANIRPLPSRLLPGVKFSAGTVLRAGIVLLGARLSFGDVVATGLGSLLSIAAGVCLIIGLTIALARSLKLPMRLAILLGAGTAICGNSAIVAIAPVVEADETEVAVAVGMITLFGTLAVIVYPMIALAAGMSADVYGQWVGLAVSDTSQVTAAAFAHSDQAGNTATVVKLTRNTLIGPAVIAAGLLYPVLTRGTAARSVSRPGILKVTPPFVLGFLALAFLNSIGALPQGLSEALYEVARSLILLALVGLGLQTSLRQVRSVGTGPLWAAISLVTALSVLALLLTLWSGA